MKNRYIIYYLVVLAIIFALIAILYSKLPKPIDWNPSFEKEKTIPYGTQLVYQNLNSIFTKNKIKTINKAIYNQLDNKKLKNTNYIFICNKLILDDLDMRTLLSYAADGNNVFISANELSYHFQDTLGCFFDVDFNFKNVMNNDVNAKNDLQHLFTNPNFGKTNTYAFKNMVFPTNIRIEDSLAYKILAYNNKKEPVFISTKYGNGHIYFHSYPYAFTNYYFLFNNNHEYISKCLSVLPNTETFWDEYYKKEHTVEEQTSNNPLKFILSTPSLRWAWYLILFGLLLYVLFRVKRQQRIIPIIKPFENSSLQFIKTVGRLYFNKGDHQDIIKKQIGYWLEYIRTKLYISTSKLDKDFTIAVSEKSGIPLFKIEEIIYLISDLRNGHASKNDVIRLYKQLEYFYTNSKR